MKKAIQSERRIQSGQRRTLPIVLWGTALALGLLISAVFLPLILIKDPAIKPLYAKYLPIIFDLRFRQPVVMLILFGVFGSPYFAYRLAKEGLSREAKLSFVFLLVFLVAIGSLGFAAYGVIQGEILFPSRYSEHWLIRAENPSMFWFSEMVWAGMGLFLSFILIKLYVKHHQAFRSVIRVRHR